ncbi:uncharacterized protein LOC117791345 [Drosophila innubila]|uniref:uncharacterized protein LOC117791345 n=1 Tax=Drosophila innubila TaxID=198719 RepID=UPI00148E4683|nr:uncharacterized protein LOC117791345 [Drosophila innubila]
MTFPFRILNWFFLVFTAVLEIVALVFLVKLLFTHCVLGGEYGISVWFYIYFLPGITAHTLVLAIFRCFWCTVGLDPIAVAFNLVSGIFCIIATLLLLFAMWDHCGNEFTYQFYISAICGLIAGIFHLINGGMCLVFMPSEEAHYLKPSKRRKTSLY